tara:strand:+ start:896 stop:1366 length:471 start_codon:yes stop_codon:yes gene_type:complete
MANYCNTTIKCNGNESAQNKFKEEMKKRDFFNEYECEIGEFDCGFHGVTNWSSDTQVVQEVAKEVIALDPNAVVGVKDQILEMEIYETYAFSASQIEMPIIERVNEQEVVEKLGFKEVPQMDDEENWYTYFDGLNDALSEKLNEIMQNSEKQKVLV